MQLTIGAVLQVKTDRLPARNDPLLVTVLACTALKTGLCRNQQLAYSQHYNTDWMSGAKYKTPNQSAVGCINE